jgi:hypothetical protein
LFSEHKQSVIGNGQRVSGVAGGEDHRQAGFARQPRQPFEHHPAAQPRQSYSPTAELRRSNILVWPTKRLVPGSGINNKTATSFSPRPPQVAHDCRTFMKCDKNNRKCVPVQVCRN